MKQLSRRQADVLEYVRSVVERLGRTPTGPEIALHFDFQSAATAYEHLHALHNKGYVELISQGRGRPLGIRLTQHDRLRPAHVWSSPHSWPVLGAIQAGPLSDTLDEDHQRLQVVRDLLPAIGTGDYFLIVPEDSMTGAGLAPGEIVLLSPGRVPDQGDICAVWVNDDTHGDGGLLRHVYSDGDTVRLVPRNPRYDERIYPSGDVRIQGVLVARIGIRRFHTGYSTTGYPHAERRERGAQQRGTQQPRR